MGKTLKVDIGPMELDPMELDPIYEKLPEPEFPIDHVHKCPVENCGKRFEKLSKLQSHVAVHSDEKPFKCLFEGCLSAYYYKSHLNRHVATTHAKRGGNYVCEFEGCFASFESYESLYYHSKRNHGQKKFACSTCQQMFSKKYLLREHEHLHTGVKPFKCAIQNCKEEFLTHANLKTHRKQHKKVVPTSHSCTECDVTFEKWSQYVAHRKIAHSKLQCPVCKLSISKSNLRQHLETHEENRTAYFCPHEGCSKVYYRTNNLTHHIRHAHEGHSYECEVCKRKMSTKQKLQLHIQILHSYKTKPESDTEEQERTSSQLQRKKLLKMLSHVSKNCLDAPKRRGPAKGFLFKKRKIEAANYNQPSSISVTEALSKICSESVHKEESESNNNNDIEEQPSEMSV